MLVAFFLLNNIFLLLKNFPLVQFVSTPCGCIARYVFNLMSVQLTKTLHTLQCPSLLSVYYFLFNNRRIYKLGSRIRFSASPLDGHVRRRSR